jgi:hypothetical protein
MLDQAQTHGGFPIQARRALERNEQMHGRGFTYVYVTDMIPRAMDTGSVGEPIPQS